MRDMVNVCQIDLPYLWVLPTHLCRIEKGRKVGFVTSKCNKRLLMRIIIYIPVKEFEIGGSIMKPNYEYKFVRLGESMMGIKKSVLDEYQVVINEHAKDGWRLVQIFSPFIKLVHMYFCNTQI